MASIANSLRASAPLALRWTARAAPVLRMLPSRSFSTSRLSLARKYTRSHEWIDISADGKHGVIGISTYAADALGDVVYVELPETGLVASAGDPVGAVESVKSASDINAPISCKVTAVNNDLEEKPATVNKVPEDDSAGGGWIVKVDVTEEGLKEFDELMDAEAYEIFTKEE